MAGHRLCARSGGIYPALHQQPAGAARGLQVSLRNILQDLLFERKIGHQLLEPTVLKLQLLELAGLLDVQTTVFPPVPVVALLGQTRILAGCGNALALTLQHLDLPQLGDNLLGSQTLLRLRFSPFQAIFSQFAWFRKCRSGQFQSGW